MSNSKISALTSATTPLAGTEVLPIVQSGVTKQVSVSNLTMGRVVLASGLITTSTGNTLVGIDAPSGTPIFLMTGVAGSQPLIGYKGNGGIRIGSVTDSIGSGFTQQLTLGNNGDLGLTVGNLIQGTAAKGINFTANTPAAGMTSQLLNWYEEGTWTPNIGGTATYTSQIGRYTRIGRLVTFMGDLTINVQGTGNAGIISGLPFSAAANNAVYVGYFSGVGALVSSISPFVGGTSINLYGVTAPASTASGLNLMTSGARLMFQGSYEV
jgi:hypothetical protein